MKTLKIVFATCAAMTASLALADANSTGKGWTDDVVLGSVTTTNCSVKVVDTTAGGTAVGGSWTANVPTIEEKSSGVKYLLIDHDDFSTSNEFTATTIANSNYVECVFNLLAAPVIEQVTPGSDVQAAFCISNTDWYCWAKAPDAADASWLKLTNSTVSVPATDGAYALKVCFDYHKSGNPHVQFAVKTTGDAYLPLGLESTYGTNAATNWFKAAYAPPSQGVQKYCFLGSGYVKDFMTEEFFVNVEVEVTGTGKVDLSPEKQEAAKATIEGSSYGTVAELLAAPANVAIATSTKTFDDDVTVATAEALGFVKVDSTTGKLAPADGETHLVVSKNKTSGLTKQSEKIQIALNINQPAGNNATITYTLKGSSDGTTWSVVSGLENKSTVADVAIPVGQVGTYKYFKVVATVSYPSAE